MTVEELKDKKKKRFKYINNLQVEILIKLIFESEYMNRVNVKRNLMDVNIISLYFIVKFDFISNKYIMCFIILILDFKNNTFNYI